MGVGLVQIEKPIRKGYDMTNKQVLEQCDKDYKDKVNEVTDKFRNIIDPKVERFQRNVIPNIPQEFGNFLYTSLGDRVTGQRSSTLNTTYFEKCDRGIEIAKKATEAKLSIEEYLKKEQKDNGDYYSHHQPKLYITVGRKFGLSYLTGTGNRVHTMYFGAGTCFKYLTQEHVDCIKNKDKRECTQMFLDYRNEFVAGIDNLHDQLIPVDIPVDIGIVNIVVSKPKFPKEGYYGSEARNYCVMEDYTKSCVTHIQTAVKSTDVWDKVQDVNSSIKNERLIAPSYVSFTFMNIDDTNKTKTILFNLDISVDGSTSSIRTYSEQRSGSVYNKGNYVNHKGVQIQSAPIAGYDAPNCEGIILNIEDVLNNSIVDKTIEDSINFFTGMTDKLRDIKHEQSHLYFLNGDM